LAPGKKETLSENKLKSKKGSSPFSESGLIQMEENVLSKYKHLTSNPNTIKNNF
jgi:hypothetical protein